MSAGIHGLTVVPDLMHALGRAVDVAAATRSLLADDECEHGRLAADSTPPCGCWPSEQPTIAAAIAPRGAPRRPTPPAMQGRVIGRERSAAGALMQIIQCNCGATWQRPAGKRGRVPACPDCQTLTTKESSPCS